MKTTKELKAMDGENGFRVFVSTLNSKGTVRVSLVKGGPEIINKDQGELVWQATYSRWNQVPDADILEVEALIAAQ